MSDEDSMSLQESEGEYDHIKVPKETWKDDAPLNVEIEQELLEKQQIYTPLRLWVQTRNETRRSIPANLAERLAFYRSYTSTLNKSYFSCWRDDIVHYLIYISVVFNTFFTGMALFFIQSFLGTYARHHHLYVTKMVPLTYGMSAMYFFVALLELTRFADMCIVYLDYFVMGIMYQFPWNSCSNIRNIQSDYVTYNDTTYEFRCMSLISFINASKDDAVSVRVSAGLGSCYLSNQTGTCNQITQMLYLGHRGPYIEHKPEILLPYFLVVWVACFAWHKQIYRRALFKAHRISHWMFVLVTTLVLLQTKLMPDVKATARKPIYNLEEGARHISLLSALAQLFVGAITTAPPIIHLLSARCDKVAAPTESFLMALGNTAFIFFRVYVETEVHAYSDNILNGFVVETDAASCYVNPCLYYWLLYFGAQTIGNFYSLIFLLTSLVHEYLTMTIMLQCFIEIYVAEYKFAKRWVTSGVIFALGIPFYMLVHNERHILSVYCRIILFLLEFFVIFAIYPLRRLFDDMMFYYGHYPSTYLFLNILWVPVSEFLAATAFVMCVSVNLRYSYANAYIVFVLLVGFMGGPFVAGLVYIIIKYLHFYQKKWILIFCPVDLWGPDNFFIRRLRKEFDSTEYIGSQAPRNLPRHLMKNGEPKTYKLDIPYEPLYTKLDLSEVHSKSSKISFKKFK